MKFDIRDSDRFFTNTDFAVNFTVKQADETTPQPITGWALSWILKQRATDPDGSAVLTKTTASGGITITNGPAGQCVVTITDTDTASLKPGAYVHELKRTDPGSEAVLCSGMAVLRRSAHIS